MNIKEKFYTNLDLIREEAEQLDELTGKGKLDNIRLYHKNKADQHGTNAFRIATNRSDSKTQKYSSELNKTMVHKAKEQRASDLIKALRAKRLDKGIADLIINLRNKKKMNEEEQLDEISGSKLGDYLVKNTNQRKKIQTKFNAGKASRDEFRKGLRRVEGSKNAIKKLTGQAKVPAK